MRVYKVTLPNGNLTHLTYMRFGRVVVIGPCYAPNTALVGANNRGVSGRIVANEQLLP
jgi:hypothetical protein